MSSEAESNVTIAGWNAALDIVIYKPHSVDKRFAGQVSKEKWKGQFPNFSKDNDWSISHDIIGEIKKSLTDGEAHNVLKKVLGEEETESDVSVILQKLVGKNQERHKSSFQLVIRTSNWIEFISCNQIDSESFRIEYADNVKDFSSYCGHLIRNIMYEETNFNVSVMHSKLCCSQRINWLKKTLVPRLVRWAKEKSISACNKVDSLQLVGLEKYTEEYLRLKEKYCKDIISNWKESSDPEKFVHEDIGIAAYLLLLWRKQREVEKWEEGAYQSFADLGCGNGLLVYLLTMEGHRGIGFDIRRRGIWDTFPAQIILKEQTIKPTLSTSFPGVDWILGNHSDELTPWVPIIAAMSGPTTCYWVLPCCPFNFTSKFQRRNAKISVWRDYLDWLKELGKDVGFAVEEDRLRIPSTKRICLVGQRITSKEMMKSEQLSFLVSENSGLGTFTPREKVEKVRNCTQVDKNLIKDIVEKVVTMCLEIPNFIGMENGTWNSGGTISLSSVAGRLSKQGVALDKLKDECGGLQTLFRNHHFIFIVEKGTVRLRIPGKDVLKSKKGKSSDKVDRNKTKPCWHHNNHPHGCPLSSDLCTWIH